MRCVSGVRRVGCVRHQCPGLRSPCRAGGQEIASPNFQITAPAESVGSTDFCNKIGPVADIVPPPPFQRSHVRRDRAISRCGQVQIAADAAYPREHLRRRCGTAVTEVSTSYFRHSFSYALPWCSENLKSPDSKKFSTIDGQFRRLLCSEAVESPACRCCWR